MTGSITHVKGLKVGHYTDPVGVTGCTVVLCEEGTVAGGEVRGSAPGTRETDLLRPMNLVEKAHAVLLSGGSAYGLDAASGVMQYLEERRIGFNVGVGVVPIVPAAILFDLNLGDYMVRPGPKEGYDACLSASKTEVDEGTVGAGTGATVGKARGLRWAVKGGVGCASTTLHSGVAIGALAVVNAWGSIVDPTSGELLAGPRREDSPGFLDTVELLAKGGIAAPVFAQNTTLGVIATDALLTKEEACKVAQMGHNGIAMAVRPSHTMYDGDAVFVLSTGKICERDNVTTLGAVAASVLARAIVRGVVMATSIAGVPSVAEVASKKC